MIALPSVAPAYDSTIQQDVKKRTVSILHIVKIQAANILHIVKISLEFDCNP